MWLEDFKRGDRMSVTLFDNVIPLFAGVRPQQCGMLGACAPQFVVEGNGDVYPCDFYVLDRYRLGNIKTDSLEEMATCDALRSFLAEPRRACTQCATCPFERICHKNCKCLNTCLLYTSVRSAPIQAIDTLVANAPLQTGDAPLSSQPARFAMHTPRGTFHAHILINAAGSGATKISAMAGGEAFELAWRQGNIVVLDKEPRALMPLYPCLLYTSLVALDLGLRMTSSFGNASPYENGYT